jgi:hypothetical protein
VRRTISIPESEAKMSESKGSKPKRLAETPIAIARPAPPPAVKTDPATALPPRLHSPPNMTDQLLAAYSASLASVGESQRAVAGGMKALALEMTGLAQTTFTEAGDSAAALICARTLADAVEIRLGYVRRSFALLIAGSTRLSEIGASLLSETSRSSPAPFAKSARAG